MRDERHEGLTEEEFRNLCQVHSFNWAPPPTRKSTCLFLERCHEIGFVSKRAGVQGTVEYVATASLRALFFDD